MSTASIQAQITTLTAQRALLGVKILVEGGSQKIADTNQLSKIDKELLDLQDQLHAQTAINKNQVNSFNQFG